MRTSLELSLRALRASGVYDPWIVERRLEYAGDFGQKVDLYHLADIEALADDHTLYVQATTRGELRDHMAKAKSVVFPIRKGDERGPRSTLERLLRSPSRWFEIWAWEQAAKGKRWELLRLRAVLSGPRIVFCAPTPLPAATSPIGELELEGMPL